MKIYYEKYDDTVQYLNTDKIPEWQPSKENITVDFCGGELTLKTEYEDGLITVKNMTVTENSQGRLIAQHLDEHMGLSIFIQNTHESDEATLTLMNHNYIVGRYLRRVKSKSEKSGNITNEVTKIDC